MNTKVLLAGIVSGITGFLLGWLIYGIALVDFTAAHTITYPGLMKEPPVLWAVFLSNTAWGFLYAYIFYKMGSIHSFGSGVSAGIVIAFLVAISIDLFYYAFMNISDGIYLCTDAIISTVLGTIMAGVVGALLGSGKKAA